MCADLDGDGHVGYTDFGIWTGMFGKCTDGKKEIPCE